MTKEKNGAKEATASEKQQPKRSQRKGGKKTIAAASGSEQREDAAAAASGSIADGIGTAETAPISVRCADAAAVLLPLGLVVGLQEVPVVVNADRLQALADGDPAAVSLVAGSGVDAAATALHQGQRSAAATTSSAAAAFDVGCGIQSLGIDAFKLIVGNSVDNGTVLLTACNLNGNVSHQQSSFVQDATVIDNQTSNDGVCPSLWIVTQ